MAHPGRRRTRGRLASLAALTLTASLITATASGNTASPAKELSCGFGPRPLPAQPAQPDEEFWELFEQYGPGWTGADSTYSVLLPDGRTAWLFSDTFLGAVNPDRSRPDDGVHLVNNSIVVQDGDELTTLVGGTLDEPESLFIPTDGSSWYWVYDGVVEDDELQIFLIKFTRFGDGMWDWEWSGTDVATLSLPDLEIQEFVPLEVDNGIQYGAYVLPHRDYTYIYGIEDRGVPKLGHVARAPRGEVLAQDEWEYFTGSGWSADPAATAPFLGDSIANEYSVTPMRGGYVLITLDTSVPLDEWRDVVAYYSCSPEGPWTKRTVIYEAPEADDPELWPYNAHAHPQFTKNGQLLISYNVNTTDFFSLWDDADRYRARFIRADLPGVWRH
ncbi:DUF4185 domain-containing protein [Phytoactinopolyspora limicola]|uniref:DUF4185 domain-containing protein n=1 Tax=Phytoactinopolyspora limicola TaxID=2715536 RepID=UPI0014094EA4|nr:DUF4185 domain-containing protein [Phytoactinopolyspora limicola]